MCTCVVCTSLEENVNDEETTKRVASCSHTMEDLEFQFDFENDLNADLGQPEEAPQSMLHQDRGQGTEGEGSEGPAGPKDPGR